MLSNSSFKVIEGGFIGSDCDINVSFDFIKCPQQNRLHSLQLGFPGREGFGTGSGS